MKSILLLLLVVMPVFAFAGGESGGGGKVVVCRNVDGTIRSAEVLDLYEGRVVYQLSYEESSEAWKTQAERIFSAAGLTEDTFPQGMMLAWFSDITSRLTFVPVGTVLLPTKDSYEVIAPVGCAVEQAANYQNDNLILISKEIWNALSETQRAALMIHESAYRFLRDHGETDSRRARHFNAYLFSGGHIEAQMPDPLYDAQCKTGYGASQTAFYATILPPDASGRQLVRITFTTVGGRLLLSYSHVDLAPDPMKAREILSWLIHPTRTLFYNSLRTSSLFEPGDELRLTFDESLNNKVQIQGTSIFDEAKIPPADLVCASSGGPGNGVPHHLALARTPGASPLNQVWREQPVLEILDDRGNLVSTDSTTVVTVEKVAGPAGELVGTTSVTAVNGLANFSDLFIAGSEQKDAGAYQLRFSATHPDLSVAGIDANEQINANGLVPAQLAFRNLPKNAVINQTLDAIVVETEDANNIACPGDNATQIALRFVAGPSGSSMYQKGERVGGPQAVTIPLLTVNGAASFAGLSFDKPGLYTLEAVAPGLAPSGKVRFALAGFGAPDHLAFVRQPEGDDAEVGAPWKTQPVIALVDAYGNRVVSDNSAVVTLSCLLPISGCLLEGEASMTMVNGLADFAGMRLRSNQAAGTAIVIEASPGSGLPNPGPYLSAVFAE